MLRSVKSTQRKMRQLELILDEGTKTINGDVLSKVSGPAKKQVKAATCNGAGVVEIELKQPFAAQPIVIRSNDASFFPGARKGGPGTDQIKLTIDNAGVETHLLIIGSDTTEMY